MPVVSLKLKVSPPILLVIEEKLPVSVGGDIANRLKVSPFVGMNPLVKSRERVPPLVRVTFAPNRIESKLELLLILKLDTLVESRVTAKGVPAVPVKVNC